MARLVRTIFLLCLTILGACQTLPAPQNSDECLLAFPVLREGLDLNKIYLVELAVRRSPDNGLVATINIPLRKGLLFVPDLKPGTYNLFFSVRTGHWDLKEERFITEVTLKPGYLTLAKAAVFINFYYQNEVFPIYEFEPRDLTSSDYQYFRRQLEAEPNFARWKYQEGDIDYSSPAAPEQPAQKGEATPITP